jgi:DNA-binding response OmpR family regulator
MKLTVAEELDLLKEENRQLRVRLATFLHVESETTARWEWNLSPTEKKVYNALTRHGNDGGVVTYERVCNMVWGTFDELTLCNMRVFYYRLRKKLQPFGIGIVCVWGEGIRLTHKGPRAS